MGEITDMKLKEIPSAFSSIFGYRVANVVSLQDIEPDYNKMHVKKVSEVV